MNQDILTDGAEILAGDLVNYVMNEGWLGDSLVVTDEDIVHFFSSIAPISAGVRKNILTLIS